MRSRGRPLASASPWSRHPRAFARWTWLTVAVGVLAACGGGSASTAADAGATRDAGVAQDGGGRFDAGLVSDAGATRDAGAPPDAGAVPDAGATRDAGVPPDAGLVDGGPSSNTACAFNRECPANERCECEAGDCKCKVGARGTGRSGVDPCVDGNACASSVCVEGRDGGYWCSGECVNANDCGPELPRCADIAFVGRICIR